MKISIIIPNYNGLKYLKTCLDSILKSKTKYDYEIIVIDNNSIDNSVELLSNYDCIRLIQNDSNTGFSHVVNQGIEEAIGEYVLLLNNDTKVNENFIENLVLAIEKDKSIFSVQSKMLKYNNKDTIDDAGDEYTILGWAYQTGSNKLSKLYNKTRKIFSSCAGAAIYRKSILNKIGYFDENFFAYMEDVDIGYRAKINGYKNIYCPDAICYHVGSATSGSKYNIFKVKLAARNNIYVFYKNMPLFQMVVNLPFFVLGCLIKYVFFVKKGFGQEYREGIVEGLRTLKKINKVPFKWRNLLNYIRIEVELVLNIFRYIFDKII